MFRRWSLGLLLSLLAHAGAVVIGLAAGARGLGGPVNVELTDMRLEELKDFPLGGPAAGEAEKPRPRRAKSRAPRAPDTGTLATPAGEEKPNAGVPALDDDAGPAPTGDLSAYGPEGSRVTVLMRLDRLRGTDYQAPVDELLMHLPDRRELLEGTGLDLFADFDVLLAATPNPRDPSVTFLAVKHHLDESALRTALTRGARATDRTLSWMKEGGRLIGERRARKGAPPVRHPDDRLILLADPGLAVVTPPTYRELLMGAGAPHAARAPDGGAPAKDADGGAPVLTAGATGAAAGGWATLLRRISAEEGLMPPEGAVMVKAVDLFKAAGASTGDTAILFGMEVPAAVSGVIGVDVSPFLDVTGEFKSEAPAKHWEAAWPALQRKWRTHPYAMLTGFSSLIGRATLEREGNTIRLHLSVTRDETLRLMTLALQVLAGRGM